MMTDDDKTSMTMLKTLWSETLLDILVVSLEKKMPDQKIIEILKELRQKRFKASYITDKVRRSLSEADAQRVKKLMGQI